MYLTLELKIIMQEPAPRSGSRRALSQQHLDAALDSLEHSNQDIEALTRERDELISSNQELEARLNQALEEELLLRKEINSIIKVAKTQKKNILLPASIDKTVDGATCSTPGPSSTDV